MSGEASSRAHLGLPGIQRRLAEAVFERAQQSAIPVIVVLFSGRPLVVPWLVERANAVLAAWFLGSEAGNAIADVLTGRLSPSGRTPVSWPRAAGQVPIFFLASVPAADLSTLRIGSPASISMSRMSRCFHLDSG
jgi:beta-glucosidase